MSFQAVWKRWGLVCTSTAFVACVGSSISLGAPAVEQSSGVPICPIDSPANCQSYNGWVQALISDDCIYDLCLTNNPISDYGAQVADDFVASATGDVTSVCVLGMYINRYTGGDCALDEIDRFTATNLPGPFTIAIYEDNNGIPGAPVVPKQVGNTIAAGVEIPASVGGRDHWRIAFSLNTPIPLVAGHVYWLEVVANTDGRDEFGEFTAESWCDWYWVNSDLTDPAEGNGLAYQNIGAAYDAQDVVAGLDFAWCMDVPNVVPPSPLRACCTCGGPCEVLTADECINTRGGTWILEQVDCAGFVCPSDPPANDLCSGAIELTTDVPYFWSNTCATDTPAPFDVADCGDLTPTPFMRDVWFNWTAPTDISICQHYNYRVSTCGPDPHPIDTILEVYTNGTSVCSCPDDPGQRLACAHDGCLFAGSGSQLEWPVDRGVCYTIRVGSPSGEEGDGSILVEKGADPPLPLAPEFDSAGNRYIPINPVNCVFSVEAIRVTFVSLDGFPLPDPPYLWVGQPYDAPDENYAVPGNTFRVAPLGCEPHFQDWTTEPPLYVYGAEIIPGSTYEFQHVLASCADLSDPLCYSSPLVVTTPKFGDVAPLFDNPGNPPQPDFNDIAALVFKFLAEPVAPNKAHAQLQPNIVDPNRPVDFRDIAILVQAFMGVRYADLFYGPCTCPSSVTCGATPCGSDLHCAGVTPDGGLCLGAFCTDPCGRCTP